MDKNLNHIKLTASELSYLWTSYLADSMSLCVLKYFLVHIDDNDIKSLTTYALELSQKHVRFIREIFTKEQIQVPQGFTEQDVNLLASRLFSDVFLHKVFTKHVKRRLVTYGRILQNVYRHDIRSFYAECLTDTLELDSKAAMILLDKGLAMRPPVIPYPQKLEFVHKQSFILEGLGRRESLTGTEVTNLYANVLTNRIGVAITTAFSQVAKSKKVRKYFLRGKDVSLKHIKVLSSYLEMDSLAFPMGFEQEVTDSNESPFSDKLMMFHFNLMIYAGVGNYGIAISESQKTDLVVDYSRFTVEVLKLSEDGANLMIENEWLEQPPLAANRRDLAKN